MDIEDRLMKMSEAEIDQELRKLGYDPEIVGRRNATLVHLIFENFDLKVQIVSLQVQLAEKEKVIEGFLNL